MEDQPSDVCAFEFHDSINKPPLLSAGLPELLLKRVGVGLADLRWGVSQPTPLPLPFDPQPLTRVCVGDCLTELRCDVM